MRVLLAAMLLAAGCRPEPPWTQGLPAPTFTAPAVAASADAIPAQAKGEEAATPPAPIPDPAAATSPSPPVAAAEIAGPDVRDQDAANADAVYAWEDEDGSLHYGQLGAVPPRLRQRARLVTAGVGSISADDSAAWPTAAAAPQAPPGTAEERWPPSPEAYPPPEATSQESVPVWSSGGVWVWARPKRPHHLAPFGHPGPVRMVRGPPPHLRPAMQARSAAHGGGRR